MKQHQNKKIVNHDRHFIIQTKNQLKSKVRLPSMKNSHRMYKESRFYSSVLTSLFLLSVVFICVIQVSQEYNLLFKPTSIGSFSVDSIDNYGCLYFILGLMIGNFYARYINGNIKSDLKGIKVLHHNIRSIQNKVADIKKIAQDESPHILGCSECELFKSNNENQLKGLKIP